MSVSHMLIPVLSCLLDDHLVFLLDIQMSWRIRDLCHGLVARVQSALRHGGFAFVMFLYVYFPT